MGSDKNSLRSLYLGYTRAVFDYNIVLQNICTNTSKNSIDTVQNHALRLISGGMRSSPTAACEIHTNIEPLESRRKRAALELYERSRRLEKDHPNRVLIEKWTPNQRLKKTTSVLDTVTELKNNHHLPENREPIERVPLLLPPHSHLRRPDIKKNLIDNSGKNTYQIALKSSALETIDSYPSTWIHAYTDGSAFKGTINAGYGATINLPNGDKREIFNSCGSFCSNYIAEQQAMTNAANHLNMHFDSYPLSVTNIVIFTDSLSTLQALESGTDVTKDITHLN